MSLSKEVRRVLTAKTERFLRTQSMDGCPGLCTYLLSSLDDDQHREASEFLRVFFKPYLGKGAYISKFYEVSPERIKAAEDLLRLLLTEDCLDE